MLESQSQELLKIAWKPFYSDNKVYYIKSIFKEQLYSILVTDLRYVWFEHCSFDDIVKKASNQRIDVETKEQVEKLIGYFKQSFEKNLTFTQLNEKLELHCGYEIGIMKLNWVFDCLLMKYHSANQNELSGPDVLYQHLTLPSQFIINNVKNNPDDPKNTSKTFTQASLDLIMSISEDQFKDEAKRDNNVISEHASVKEEPESQESLMEKEEQRKLKIQQQLENVIRDQGRRSQAKKKRRIL